MFSVGTEVLFGGLEAGEGFGDDGEERWLGLGSAVDGESLVL